MRLKSETADQKLDLKPSDPSVYDEGYFMKGKLGGYRKYNEDWYVRVSNEGRAKSILKLPEIRNLRVLELGCATGMVVGMLRNEGVDAVGVDVSEWAISHPANELAAQHICLGTLQQQKFPDKSFDVVASWDFLEHLTADELDKPGPWGAPLLDEIHRVCRKLVIAGIADYTKKAPREDKTHKTLMPGRWWDELFRNHNFLKTRFGRYKYVYKPVEGGQRSLEGW